MKIVVNKCYGGFGVSPKALSRYYELKGITAYHFTEDYGGLDDRKYTPIKEGVNHMFITSFSVPNPNDFEVGELWNKYYLTSRPDDRTDPLLIQTIEELGEEESSASLSKLVIIEIPDGIDYEIDDYDGVETIHEIHQSW